MIVVISLNKSCYEILQKVLGLHMYHAHDSALCSDTSLQNPLPLRCHASDEVCLIHCATIREMHFITGALYPALRRLKTFIYVLSKTNTHCKDGLYAVHSVQNNGGQRLYIDMLHAWYTDEITLNDNDAYEFVVLIQRFWQSHHAQIMLIQQNNFDDEQTISESMQREINKIFERLQSIPLYHTENNCLALVEQVHNKIQCSFTQRRQLYTALRAQEMRYGQIPQNVQKIVDGITHTTRQNMKTSEKKIAFRTLLHALTQNE